MNQQPNPCEEGSYSSLHTIADCIADYHQPAPFPYTYPQAQGYNAQPAQAPQPQAQQPQPGYYQYITHSTPNPGPQHRHTQQPTPQPQPHQQSLGPPVQPLQQAQPQSRPASQVQPQHHNVPPPRGQQHHAAANSSQSPDADPGAPRADPASPTDELEAQLRDALNNDAEQAQQDLAAQYPNQGDEDEPMYNLPAPPENSYPSEAELEKHMHSWSLEHGYELVRRASKRNARGEIYKRYYDCSKHARKGSKITPEQRKRKSRPTNNTECPMGLAVVAVDPLDPRGEWQIRHKKSHHNHPPEEGKKLSGHRRRFRNENLLKAVDGLFAIGTSTSQVVQFLHKTSQGGLFTRTDVANMKLKYNKYGTCADPKSKETRSATQTKMAGGACHKCRAKHYACDGRRPVCNKCEQNDTAAECVYDERQTRQPDQLPTQETQDAADGQQAAASDDVTMLTDDTRREHARERERPGPRAGRGRPSNTRVSNNDPAAAGEILEELRKFQKEHFVPQRLELRSSAVETLAQATCGTGSHYKNLPLLSSPHEWQYFKSAVIEAALKENAHDVLLGRKGEPTRPDPIEGDVGKPAEVDRWNEYIKQLAIYNRRNEILLAGLLSKVGHYYRARVSGIESASGVWALLEDLFKPRGCEQAFHLFVEMNSISLANSADLKDYVYRLESTYDKFKQLPLNTTPLYPSQQARGVNRVKDGGEAMPEEMVCLLFLQNLGPEWRRWVDGLCATNNIGGFGTGERLGLKELCKRAIGYEAMQRRELGRA